MGNALIAEAIEVTSFLYLKRKEKGISAGFAKEIRRLEILYAASIIEALFLYVFKQRGESMHRVDYKDVHILPSAFQSGTSRLVVAKQIKSPKPDRELMLDNLLDFFYENGTIKKKLKQRVDTARNVRNTFHLAKSRKGIRCDAASVNAAYDAVIEMLNVAKVAIQKGPANPAKA